MVKQCEKCITKEYYIHPDCKVNLLTSIKVLSRTQKTTCRENKT